MQNKAFNSNIPYMKNTLNVSGSKIKLAVSRTCAIQGITREEFVVFVQKLLRDEYISFSLAGLDKLFTGHLPKKNSMRVLEAVSHVCGCSASDFAESEAKTA